MAGNGHPQFPWFIGSFPSALKNAIVNDHFNVWFLFKSKIATGTEIKGQDRCINSYAETMRLNLLTCKGCLGEMDSNEKKGGNFMNDLG